MSVAEYAFFSMALLEEIKIRICKKKSSSDLFVNAIHLLLVGNGRINYLLLIARIDGNNGGFNTLNGIKKATIDFVDGH